MNKIATPLPDLSTVKALESAQEKITVLDPVGYPPQVIKKALAPRLESLDGKTVYLVDCRFDDSIELLKQVHQRMSDTHSAVNQLRSVRVQAEYG